MFVCSSLQDLCTYTVPGTIVTVKGLAFFNVELNDRWVGHTWITLWPVVEQSLQKVRTKSDDQLHNSVSTSISSCFTQPGFVDLQITAHHDELPN